MIIYLVLKWIIGYINYLIYLLNIFYYSLYRNFKKDYSFFKSKKELFLLFL